MSIPITVPLATTLIAQQFPQYAHLPIEAVEPGGVDNKTFRLGDALLLRLPRAPKDMQHRSTKNRHGSLDTLM